MAVNSRLHTHDTDRIAYSPGDLMSLPAELSPIGTAIVRGVGDAEPGCGHADHRRLGRDAHALAELRQRYYYLEGAVSVRSTSGSTCTCPSCPSCPRRRAHASSCP